MYGFMKCNHRVNFNYQKTGQNNLNVQADDCSDPLN